MPAFFNGIFGHKPSTGIVPNGPGQIPAAYGLIDTFLGTLKTIILQILMSA